MGTSLVFIIIDYLVNLDPTLMEHLRQIEDGKDVHKF